MENKLNFIDESTTFFKQLDVTQDCHMFEFGTAHFSSYQPEDGFGYFRITDSDFETIPLHKKIILMNEVYML